MADKSVPLGQVFIVPSFAVFGAGTNQPPAQLDTLVFTGKGQSAANMILTQQGADVLITFDGDSSGTGALLLNVTIEQLENVTKAGNFRFAGESAVKDNVDVWDQGQSAGLVLIDNGATFLNDQNNAITGRDKSNDIINGQGGSDRIAGLGGNDILRGGSGADWISGDDGNDILDGGSGIDRLAGGKGNDLYIVDNPRDLLLEIDGLKQGGGIDLVKASVDFTLAANIENLTLTGAANLSGAGNGLDNVMIGNGGINHLFGYAGKDKLDGGAGDDVLDGGAGADILIGGAGNDIYYVDSLQDKIVEALAVNKGGDPSDEIRASISYSLKSLANIEALTLLGGLDLNATGNAANNTLSGNAGSNRLDGGAGADLMIGGKGDDTYIIDNAGDRVSEAQHEGRDTIILNAANLAGAFSGIDAIDNAGGFVEDVIYKGNLDWSFSGNSADNVLTGGGGINILSGLDGNDRLIGGGKNDTLTGGNGADLLDGGKGNDVMKGGGGDAADDTYIIDSIGDVVDENGEASLGDRVIAGISIDLTQGGFVDIENVTLTGKAKLNATGNSLRNTLYGNDSANILDGGADYDLLLGGGGNDILIAGPDGGDIYGGAGIDTVKFAGLRGTYTITPGFPITSNSLTFIVDTDNLADGDDGTVYFSGIEILEFSDKTLYAPSKIIDKDAASTAVLKAGQVVTGQAIGITAQAIDQDNGANPFTYSLTDNAGGRFTIDANSGKVTVTQASLFDHEWQTSRTIIIRAMDIDGLYTEQSFTIKIVPNEKLGKPLSTIDLGALPAKLGFRIEGGAPYENLGNGVAALGDMNGDGFADLTFGATGIDAGGGHESGTAYVLLGKAGGFPSRLGNGDFAGKSGFTLAGTQTYANIGDNLAGVGDINGDGFADLLAASKTAGPNGAAYLIFGKAGGFGAGFSLGDLDGIKGFTLGDGGTSGNFGDGCGALGDVNGDGFSDFFVAAQLGNLPGKMGAGLSYVIFGSDGGFNPVFDTNGLSGQNGFRIDGAAAADRSQILAGGDLNGDGFSDIVIGSPNADPGGTSDAGSIAILYGKAGGFPGQIDLANAIPAADGLRIDGTNAFNTSLYLGSACAIGDLNGDGIGDLVMGLMRGDPNAYNGGATYVLFGQAGAFAPGADIGAIDQAIDGKNSIKFTSAKGDGIGTDVAIAGDVNGDGFEDLLIGASNARYKDNSHQTYTGVTYLIYGKADWSANGGQIDLASLTPSQGFRIDGAATYDYSGLNAVSAAGDINGDGFDDILIGAYEASPGGKTYAGAAYVLYGGDFTHQAAKIGGAKADIIKGKAASENLLGGAGNDFIQGGGGIDYLAGGAGNDSLVPGDATFRRIDGGAGVDILRLDALMGAIDLTALGALAHKLENIEILDLAGAKGNKLILDESLARNLPGENGRYLPGNSLIVTGDREDSVSLAGGWQDLGLVTDPASMIGEFHEYKLGQALLYIDSDIAILQQAAAIQDSGAQRIDAGSAGGGFGQALAGLGDIDGDGFADFLVGAPLAQTGAGSAYLFLGSLDRPNVGSPDSLDGSQGLALTGGASSRAGDAIAGAGDVNGDGFADFLVGAPYAQAKAGETYLIFGGSGLLPASLDLTALGSAGITITGAAASDYSGSALAGAGDINGDGYGDFLIGAGKAHGGDGALYAILGGAAIGDIDLANLGAGQFEIKGVGGGKAGYSLSAAGDVNGDGFDDFLIGAPNYNNAAGAAYLLFGKAGWNGQDLTQLDGTNGLLIAGVNNSDQAGAAIAGVGDVNGDGFDDFLIGAPYADAGLNADSGIAYLMLGKADWSATMGQMSVGAAAAQFRGVGVSDLTGASLSGAGDFNGDGYADMLIGAWSANAQAGAAYLIFGKAGGFSGAVDLGTLAPADGFRIDGVTGNDYLGRSLTAAGDIDGDGFDDILIGAEGTNVGQGASYILYGGNFAPNATKLGGLGNDALTGSALADVFFGGGGKDILVGKGGADAMDGGAGDDTIILGDALFTRAEGGGGIDLLKFDFAGAIDLHALADRISGFETISFDNGKANAASLHLADLLDFDLDNRDLGGVAGLDNALKIDGNKGDSLTLLNSDGWSLPDFGTLSHYAIYGVNGWRIAIDTDIQVTIS